MERHKSIPVKLCVVGFMSEASLQNRSTSGLNNGRILVPDKAPSSHGNLLEIDVVVRKLEENFLKLKTYWQETFIGVYCLIWQNLVDGLCDSLHTKRSVFISGNEYSQDCKIKIR